VVLHAPVHVEMQRDGVHRLYSADVWEDLEIRILIVADRCAICSCSRFSSGS